jgi:hypothetical protein
MEKIRMILPAIAILFAVAGTFVTIASPKSTITIEVGYTSGACSLKGECDIDRRAPSCQMQTPANEDLYNRASLPYCEFVDPEITGFLEFY